MVSVLRPGKRILHIPAIGVRTSRRAVSAGGGVFTGTNFFTQSYTGTRNNFTGQVGFNFVTASEFTIIALGRSISSAMAAAHTIRLWRFDDQALVASVVVTPSSPVDALGYAYELLASPFTVAWNKMYYLASTELSGGDMWRDDAPLTGHSALAAIYFGIYNLNLDTFSGFATYGNGWVPPTFYT
jgi:hypothetical protein